MQDTPTFRELRQPYPNAPLDPALFEDASDADEYISQLSPHFQCRSPLTESDYVQEALARHEWTRADRLLTALLDAGVTPRPSNKFYHAAIAFLDLADVPNNAARSRFLQYWRITPNARWHYGKDHFAAPFPLASKVLQRHGQSELSIRDVMDFAVIGASKGYGGRLATIILPYVLPIVTPAEGLSFYKEFESAVQSFHANSDVGIQLMQLWRVVCLSTYHRGKDRDGKELFASFNRENPLSTRDRGSLCSEETLFWDSKRQSTTEQDFSPLFDKDASDWLPEELAEEFHNIRSHISHRFRGSHRFQPPLRYSRISAWIVASEATGYLRNIELLREYMLRRGQFTKSLWFHAELHAYKTTKRYRQLLKTFNRHFVPRSIAHVPILSDRAPGRSGFILRTTAPQHIPLVPVTSTLAMVWHALVELESQNIDDQDPSSRSAATERVEHLYSLLLRPLREGLYDRTDPGPQTVGQDELISANRSVRELLPLSLKPIGTFFDPFMAYFGQYVSQERVMRIMADMRAFQIPVSSGNWTALIHTFARRKDETSAFTILNRMSHSELSQEHNPVKNEALNASDQPLPRQSSINSTLNSTLNSFPPGDVVTYTAAMTGFIESRQLKAARKVEKLLTQHGYVKGTNKTTDKTLAYLNDLDPPA